MNVIHKKQLDSANQAVTQELAVLGFWDEKLAKTDTYLTLADRAYGWQMYESRGGIYTHAEPQIDELESAEEDLPHNKKFKQRRGCYSGHREVILTRAEDLKEFIPHQTLLIDLVLKREIAHIVLVRN